MLGELFSRSYKWSVENTVTGETSDFTIVTDGQGAYPEWGSDYILTIPAVFKATTLLSDVIGSFPWDAYNSAGSSIGSELLNQPYPPESRAVTLSALTMDYLLNGNAVAIYTAYDSDGVPTAMVPVPADHVGVKMEGGRRVYSIGDKTYDQDEIYHVKGPARPGSLRGLSRNEQFYGTFQLSKDQERAAKGASNSGVPTGLLKVTNPDATVEDLRATKTGWMNAQATRTVAVLNATTEFEALSWNPTEAQLIEARKFTIHEVGLIFGLPLKFLGVDSASMTYGNAETEALDLLKFTVGPILVRFEQEFASALPRGTYVKANTDSLLKSDTLTRYQAHEIGIRSGWLLKSEVRALEDLAVVPDIDNPPEPTTAEDDDPKEEADGGN